MGTKYPYHRRQLESNLTRFAAYSASKGALNMMLRHMAAELQRKKVYTAIIAMHPGEVAT